MSKAIATQFVPATLIEEFRSEVRARYLAQASARIEPWCAQVAALQRFIDAGACLYGGAAQRALRAIKPALDRSRWFTVERESSTMPDKIFISLVEVAKARKITVREDVVIADADARVQEAVDFFNVRVAEKVAEVANHYGLNLSLAASWVDLAYTGGVIVGAVHVAHEGLTHSWSIKLMTNYRYGENAANGHLTVYWQVPCKYLGSSRA